MISYGYPKASELGSLVIYGTMDSGKQRSQEETNSINTKSNIDTEFKEGGGETESLLAQQLSCSPLHNFLLVFGCCIVCFERKLLAPPIMI